MAGLNEQEVKALIKRYFEQRESLGGPKLTVAQAHLVVAEIQQIEAGEGDVLQKFVKIAQARRDIRPNPLKPAASRNRQ